MITKVRLWKSLTNKLEEINEYEKKWKNSSIVRVDATILNLIPDADKTQKFVEDLPIAEGEPEIILVELPNSKKDFILRPSSGELDDGSKKPEVITEPVVMSGDAIKLEELE